MFGLEAIVMKENRPVVFVRGNFYDDVGTPWSSLNAAEVKTRLSKLFPLIGRIELPNSALLPYAGTGFVVGKGQVATTPRNDGTLQDKIFGGVYYVKRLQPGVVRAGAKAGFRVEAIRH